MGAGRMASNIALDALYGMGAVSGMVFSRVAPHMDTALSNGVARYGIPATGLGVAAMDWAGDGDMSMFGIGGAAIGGAMLGRGAYTGAMGTMGGFAPAMRRWAGGQVRSGGGAFGGGFRAGARNPSVAWNYLKNNYGPSVR